MGTPATNITVEIFALIVTLLLLSGSRLEKSRKDRLRLLMRSILIGNAALLTACIATWALEGNARYEMLDTVLTALSNGLVFPMAGLYTEYIVCYIGDRADAPKRFAHIIKVLCLLALALNFVSVFNGMYFACPGGAYARGPLFLLNQLCFAFILLSDAIIILKCRRVFVHREMLPLISFAVLPPLAALAQYAFSGLTVTCLATTLSVIIIYVSFYIQRGQKLVEQEQELTESRIFVMLSQIQPHFLYNALTAIARLCDLDPAKAKKATLDFSDYLRGNLDSLSQKQPVLFSTELRHTQIYADIEKIRFGDKLNVEYDIQADGFLIPSLTVQPLVENAVKYGVGKKKGGGTVYIRTGEAPDGWRITVSDDGVGFDPAKEQCDGRTHIGIDNVRRRLALQSGGTLSIQSVPGVGTTAEILIPREGKAK